MIFEKQCQMYFISMHEDFMMSLVTFNFLKNVSMLNILQFLIKICSVLMLLEFFNY